MNSDIKNIIIDNQKRYRNLDLSKFHLFVQPQWLDSILGKSQWSAKISIDNNDDIRWAWAYAKPSRKYGILKWTPPPFTPYNDIIIFDDSDLVEVVDKIYKQLPPLSYLKIKHANTKNQNEINGRLRNKQYYPKYKSLEDYWKKINKSKRKKLSKNWSYQIEDTPSPQNIMEGLQGTMIKNNMNSIHKGIISRIMSYDGNVKGLLLKNSEGIVLGSQIILWDKNTAYFLLRGKNYSLTDLPVSEILRWESIRLAHSKGLQIDLCGSEIPGVANFNREMGAQNTMFPEFTLYKPKFLKNFQSIVNRKI